MAVASVAVTCEPKALSIGTFCQLLLLFGLGVGFGAFHVYLSFVARELDLERLALQKRAMVLQRQIERLEFEKRQLADQPTLRQLACREYGFVELSRTQRTTVAVPASLRDKYQMPAKSIEVAMPSFTRSPQRDMVQFFVEQLAAVSKVQAASGGSEKP